VDQQLFAEGVAIVAFVCPYARWPAPMLPVSLCAASRRGFCCPRARI
jgi:hypothetical protein